MYSCKIIQTEKYVFIMIRKQSEKHILEKNYQSLFIRSNMDQRMRKEMVILPEEKDDLISLMKK